MKKLLLLLILIGLLAFPGVSNSVIKTSSLKAAYRFEGNSTDWSGNTNTGSDTSMTYSTGGKFGRHASFNGSDGFITVSDAASLNFTTAISFSVWIKKGTNNLFGFNAVKRVFDGNQQYSLGLFNGTTDFRVFNYNDSGGTSHQWSPSDQAAAYNTFNDGNWHHWAMSYTFGSGSSMKFYIDGVETPGSWVSGTGNGAARTDGGNLLIGKQNSASPAFFNGNHDEFRLFSKALTASEIRSLMLNFDPTEF